jgi:hypothetical protein
MHGASRTWFAPARLVRPGRRPPRPSRDPAPKEAVEFSNGNVTNPTFGQDNPLRLNEAPREIVVDFVED